MRTPFVNVQTAALLDNFHVRRDIIDISIFQPESVLGARGWTARGRGAAARILQRRPRRDPHRDQDLHRHDRGHGPVHLRPPGQRQERDHQDEPLH